MLQCDCLGGNIYGKRVNLQIYLRTLFWGRRVGEDENGNRYYEDKYFRHYGMLRRWVIYKGWCEASRIPPAWHAWIHYMIDTPPTHQQRYIWEKEHLPNLSGTRYSYKPTQSKNMQEQRGFIYKPWNPKEPKD